MCGTCVCSSLCVSPADLDVRDTFVCSGPFIHPPHRSPIARESNAERSHQSSDDCGNSLLWWNEDFSISFGPYYHAEKGSTVVELREVWTPESTNDTVKIPYVGCRVQLVEHNISKHRLILTVATSPACSDSDFLAAVRVAGADGNPLPSVPTATYVEKSKAFVVQAEVQSDAPKPHSLSGVDTDSSPVFASEPTSFKQAETNSALRQALLGQSSSPSHKVETLPNNDAKRKSTFRYGGFERVVRLPVDWLKSAEDGDYEVRAGLRGNNSEHQLSDLCCNGLLLA